MANYRYLSDEGLKHLDNHKYAGVDNSWLAAHGLSDFWNWAVELVPLWVAPNVLTFAGFLCQVTGFALMSYYNPDFKTRAPWWVYFACVVGLFLYQTLDNIDGKQARRTGSSSPLGELFDHVSDAMGVGMIVTTVGAGCQAGAPWTLVIFFCTITPFFMYHWEEYFTGELILGAYDGPTETQFLTMAFHSVSGTMALLSIDFWGSYAFQGFAMTDIFSAVYCLMCIASTIKLQFHLWSSTNRLGVPVEKVMSVAMPFFSFLLCASVYSLYNYSVLLSRHNWDESRLLFFVLGALFGYITSRLIVQRVLKEPAPLSYPILIPIALAAVHSVLVYHFGAPQVVDEHIILKALAVFTLLMCAHFFYTINWELTSYLGINTFTIPYPPPAPRRGRTRAPAATKTRSKSRAKSASGKKAATSTAKGKSPSRKAYRSRSRSTPRISTRTRSRSKKRQ